jgi:hypothetical protein
LTAAIDETDDRPPARNGPGIGFNHRTETAMNDVLDKKAAFRLSDLDTKLKALIPDKESLMQGFYYCCECVGNPECPASY